MTNNIEQLLVPEKFMLEIETNFTDVIEDNNFH